MNFRAFQYRKLYLSRGGPGVLEMQKSCMTGNAKLFALLEDLIPHRQRLRRSIGESERKPDITSL